MCCILKNPDKYSKGFLIITSSESRLINNFFSKNKIFLLKKKWFIGVHHNWHDYHFDNNSLYDFHLSGQNDIKPINNILFNNIFLDCCNFPPDNFSFNNKNKFWDIVAVIRPVYFKRLYFFLDTIKKLFKKSGPKRVLCITPFGSGFESIFNVTNYNFNKVMKYFKKNFSEEERRFINFIATKHDPLPFDLKTLSFFYKHSKIFIHTSAIERRPRISAYAFRAGMPVVAKINPASILPPYLQKEPFLFLVKKDSDFVKKISDSLKFADSSDYNLKKMKKVMHYFNDKKNQKILIKKLTSTFKIPLSKNIIKSFKLNDLNFRLGHSHLSKNKNHILMILESLYLQLKLNKEPKSDFDENQFNIKLYNMDYIIFIIFDFFYMTKHFFYLSAIYLVRLLLRKVVQ